MEKFHVKNLDCANCAAKIERGLQKVDGIDDAVLDFANLILHVKAKDIDQVIEEVRRIEPNIKLVPQKQNTASTDNTLKNDFHPVKELSVLAAAAVIFLFLLIFENRLHAFAVSGLEIGIVMVAYLLAGWNVILGAFRTIRRGTFFDENVLMVIATAGAMAIHAYSEAVGVMIFYKVGELLQNYAVSRSRRSIKALLSARPDKALVKTDTGFHKTAPESVKPGEIIMIKPGEKIPLDGEIQSGKSQLDSSALTGEFVPVSAGPGSLVMAGQINKTGVLTVRVTRLFKESSIVRIMDLVENAAARKARTEKFITSFAKYYTPAVVLIAACIAFLPPVLTDASFKTWIYRALVLLVISCPCALVISIPLGYFGGIGRASRRGILVKGSNYIDTLANVKTVVFDKTGTLTRGVFNVKEIVSLNGFSREQLLEFAAAAEYQSNHPIAVSITKAFSKQHGNLDASKIFDHTEIAGNGVQVRYGHHTIFAGNDHMLHQNNIDHEQCSFDGTAVNVAVDGKLAGYIVIGDEIKEDAKEAVLSLKRQGVEHLAMLTGDNACTAEAVSKQLDLDEYYADLLPEDKVKIYEKIENDHQNIGKIAFVGDGINDAPVIARADVGIAMGALGSDAAIETADVVLMTDSPLKIAEAVSIAKSTRSIVWQNIFLAFFIKGIFITLGSFGLATMWEAVFADMGTALLAVGNSTRILGKGGSKITHRM